MAALTGLRIGEVLAMRWHNLDPETGRLLLPDTKTGRRWHDLPAPAMAVLDGLPRWSAWCFTATGRAPVAYKSARQCFADAAKAAGIADARLHDLRRTVATRAASMGASVFVLRDMLGHKTVAMAERYARAVDDPVREARERVGAEIAGAMAGRRAEVAEIAR